MLLFLFLWRILIQSSFCERKLLSTQKPIFSEITFPDKQKWRHIFFIRPIHEWGWSLANILIAFWYWLESWVKKAMAPHASSLAWKIPWMEEPGGLQSMGSQRVWQTERLHFHFSLSCIGKGNGNPLQCSCLENPRDGGAWWAAVYVVAQSRTRLKWLSSRVLGLKQRTQISHSWPSNPWKLWEK